MSLFKKKQTVSVEVETYPFNGCSCGHRKEYCSDYKKKGWCNDDPNKVQVPNDKLGRDHKDRRSQTNTSSDPFNTW